MLEDSESDADLVTDELERAGMQIVTERVDSQDTFTAALREFSPDVVLAERTLGRFGAPDALAVVRSITPATPMIVVSDTLDESCCVSCVRAGIEDLVLKADLSRLPAAIDNALSVRRRLSTLSPRQLQVLRLVSEGNTTREIARRLRLSAKTVDTHRGEAMRRLDIHDVVSLVRFAIRVGIVEVENI
jgi:DNA-binding NarL/FixJ family response regulator